MTPSTQPLTKADTTDIAHDADALDADAQGADAREVVTQGAGARDADAQGSDEYEAFDAQEEQRHWSGTLKLLLLAAFVLVVMLIAITLGRYIVPPGEVARIITNETLANLGFPDMIRRTWQDEELAVVMSVRLPRVLVGAIIGGGLAIAGAALQALFRNPLVSPDVIGVSAGASFGGVLAIIMGLGSIGLVTSAFTMGLVAMAIVLLFGQVRTGSAILMIVLGGVVVASFFNSLISLVTFLADPYTTLPSITFWLMGSLASAGFDHLSLAATPICIGTAIILFLRWRINILSLGDEDALSLGVDPRTMRALLITAVAIIAAGSVAAAGIVGWVGLVIPHLVRLWVGPDHRVLLPGSFLMGAGFLVLIDTASRTISAGEIPLGVLTALIGAPFFAFLLIRNRSKEHALA